MILPYTYRVGSGKRVLITACIHGNEPCGYYAIHNVMNEINTKKISLLTGSVTFLPISNPRGFEQKVRFIDENLGRIIKHYENPISYEQQLSNEIINLIDDKDAILDIHSGNALGSTFVFQDYDDDNYTNLTNSLGFNMVIHGRADLYKDIGQDLTGYAHTQGIPSVLIECGQHEDPQSIDIAQQSIYRFLSYHGIISRPGSMQGALHIRMDQIIYKAKEGVFDRQRHHGDIIKKGDVLVRYKDGELIIALRDGYIILPKDFAKLGDEWFYTGYED